MLIRDSTDADLDAIYTIINEAAVAYRGAIPDDCWHEPYMPRDALLHEMSAGVKFAVCEEGGDVIGVMGVQRVRDATLIRHAYIHLSQQRRGLGGELMRWLIARAKPPLLVGTWAAATWAIRFYERHGFTVLSREETDRLLQTYWTIPARQRETSVVLRYSS